MGLEYRVSVSEEVSLLPRLGYRFVDAPWGNADNLPVTGVYKLVLDTDDNRFNIFTFGLGVSWITEEGKTKAVNIAGDVGGDSFNVAIGYQHEF